MRPVLAPAAHRCWRSTDALQLGLAPAPALVVEGLSSRRVLLGLLDGSRTREQVVADAVRLGCQDADAALTTLEEAGVLLDADCLIPPGMSLDERDRLAPDVASLTLVHGDAAPDALAARRTARVVVHGAGRIGAPLAALLAGAGVGTVDVHDRQQTRLADAVVGGLGAEDVGVPRGEAVARRFRSAQSRRPPALVVLADQDALDVAPLLVRDHVPHLVVRVDGPVGTVGPLVLPGRTACLRCLDLVRAAIDPAWPALLAQNAGGAGLATHAIDCCDGVLAVAVASQAALQVLQLLEGHPPASVGGTLELTLPGWQWRRRSWPPHPACACAADTERHVASA